jgi:ankyrin repeat protein
MTSLALAAEKGRVKFMECLLESSADVNMQDEQIADDDLWARRFPSGKRSLIPRYSNGSSDQNSTTVLMHSVVSQRFDVTRLLLDYGADPTIRRKVSSVIENKR